MKEKEYNVNDIVYFYGDFQPKLAIITNKINKQDHYQYEIIISDKKQYLKHRCSIDFLGDAAGMKRSTEANNLKNKMQEIQIKQQNNQQKRNKELFELTKKQYGEQKAKEIFKKNNIQIPF